MIGSLSSSSSGALLTLAILTFLYFLENFDRYLIAVSPIPYIDFTSYEYSLIAGPAFTVIYTFGGLAFALYYSDDSRFESSSSSTTSKWRLSKLGILSLCSAIFSVVFTSTALCTEFWQQVIIRLVMGLSQSVITPFSTSIIKDLFPPSACGAAFGIFNSGTYFAFSFSLSMGTYIYNEYGWKAGYFLFGIIGLGVSLFLPCMRRCYSPLVEQKNPYGLLTSDDQESTNRESHLTVNNLLHGADDTCNHPRVDVVDDVSSSTSGRHHSNSNSSHSSAMSAAMSSTQARYLVSPFLADSDATVQTSLSLRAALGDKEVEFDSPNPSSTMPRMTKVLNDTIKKWLAQPAILVVCLATGVRLGGGYIWSNYTGVFYSPLFTTDSDGGSNSCHYSYNSTIGGVSSMCDSDYPYCVSDECSALSSYPWHNTGMDAIKVEEFMSWVPIAGSALGSTLGGFLSDYLVKKFDNDHESVGTLGVRALLSGIGNLLALPLIVWSFFLPFPGCFLIYIASGMVGEIYFSQALAMVSDHRIVARDLVTSSVALFMLIVTIMGGNAPLLIPCLMPLVGYDEQVTLHFTASSSDPSSPPVDEQFSVSNDDAQKLQRVLLYGLGGCYLLSGVLYLLAYFIMRQGKASK